MFAGILACIYPFIRNVDDLFNISTELAVVTVAIMALARKTTEMLCILLLTLCSVRPSTVPATLAMYVRRAKPTAHERFGRGLAVHTVSMYV